MSKTPIDQLQEAITIGVQAATIADAVTEHLSPQVLARARQEANQTFRHANLDHPAMQVLQQLCIHRRARQLIGKV